MICPKCTFKQPDNAMQCLRCGVIFAKLHPANARQASDAMGNFAQEETFADDRPSGSFPAVPEEGNFLQLAGRWVVWVVLLIWGGKFILPP